MYSKLAIRNVWKSFRDYAIYFLTLMFGVCIFYVFNSIESQQSMMVITRSEATGIETLKSVMGYISVFVSIILGFLIVYANRFLVRRRKKELAIYQLLGMEKGQISRVLLIETVIVAIISLAVGLALGVVVSQGFAVLTASLFEVKLSGFKFIFSTGATLKAILYFGIAFLMVILFNRITVGRQKLIDLLYAERKNEKFRMPHLFLSVIVFIVAAVCLGTAYYLVEKHGARIQDELMMTAVALGFVGTFLFFFSLSGFFLKVIQQSKKTYFKDLNMFVLRQINSKINTAFASISMVCLMLFLSICALSFGMGFSKSLTTDLERLHPFDVSYNLSMRESVLVNRETEEFEGDSIAVQVNLIEELQQVKTPIESYAKDIIEVTFREVYVDPTTSEVYMHGAYMTLSDYNKILEVQGKPAVTLADNEFILNCLNDEHRNQYTEHFQSHTVNMFDTDLTLKAVDNTVLYNIASVGNYSCIHILPDKLLANAKPYANILLINYIDQTHEYMDLRRQATNEMLENLKIRQQDDEHLLFTSAYASDRIIDFEDSKSTAVTFAYLAVYLGIVFSVISAVVLAITQLSEASDNSHRYGLLRKLGADKKMIDRALFRQIAIYFGVPLLLALVHSIFGIRFANDMIAVVGRPSVLRDSIVTAVIIIVVYGGYFMATYFGSKKIIMTK